MVSLAYSPFKKNDILFVAIAIILLTVTIFLFKGFTSQIISDFDNYSVTITNITKLKSVKIQSLSDQLAAKEKENQDLRNTLADTRNQLENLTKKLTLPTAAGVAVSAPADVNVTK